MYKYIIATTTTTTAYQAPPEAQSGPQALVAFLFDAVCIVSVP